MAETGLRRFLAAARKRQVLVSPRESAVAGRPADREPTGARPQGKVAVARDRAADPVRAVSAPQRPSRLRADMSTPVTVAQLKALIVQKLNLNGVTAESFGDDDPLFGPQGIGLDSVDALELVLALESEYGIQIQDA
jgi:acyl carrier protein